MNGDLQPAISVTESLTFRTSCLGILQKFCLTFSKKEVRILQVEVRKEAEDAYHLKGPGDHSD
jgi:hypothetical protein